MATIDAILNELRTLESTYRPNAEQTKRLNEQNLVLFVSPVASGKSTLMNRITQLDNTFSRIGGFVTRPQRPDDETDLYRYISHDVAGLGAILDRARQGNIIQYAIHPTTGYIYGTAPEDYANTYNCKDVLGHAVPGFRVLPARAHFTFSLVCEPEQWRTRIDARYPDIHDPERTKRMQEAEKNLAWSIADDTTIFIANEDGQLDKAARTIIAFCRGEHIPIDLSQPKLRAVATSMLTFARAHS